jgi:hypothetical protein
MAIFTESLCSHLLPKASSSLSSDGYEQPRDCFIRSILQCTFLIAAEHLVRTFDVPQNGRIC